MGDCQVLHTIVEAELVLIRLVSFFVAYDSVGNILGISGNDTAVEGVWRHWNGALMEYFNWGFGEPSGDEHCIMCHVGVAQFSWNDMPCINDVYFVCEI